MFPPAPTTTTCFPLPGTAVTGCILQILRRPAGIGGKAGRLVTQGAVLTIEPARQVISISLMVPHATLRTPDRQAGELDFLFATRTEETLTVDSAGKRFDTGQLFGREEKTLTAGHANLIFVAERTDTQHHPLPVDMHAVLRRDNEHPGLIFLWVRR